MAKYSDLINAAMGASAEKTNSMNKHDPREEIPGTPINAPIAVSESSYYPFSEDTEMLDLADAGAEDGSGNLSNMENGDSTGNPVDEDEDQVLKLKLEALSQLK
jgi:hypothetical protein